MIETLRIVDLAIVERVELEFGPGLNVLTGETGAGKSIVLGALSLLAGGRASPELVRDGVERAEVEAVFGASDLPSLEAELRALELIEDEEPADDLIVQRVVNRAGRSRARVAGVPLPAGKLAGLFEGRVEISSQHSSQALLRPDQHARLLDEAGGHVAKRVAVEEACARLRALDAERDGLRKAAEERERRQDFLRFQISEIEAVGLTLDELPELETEHRRLAHAEHLREDGATVVGALMGAVDSEAAGGLDQLALSLIHI